MPTWSAEGEHSVAGMVRAFQPILERGGTLVGAFDATVLAGLAIYRPRLSADVGNLALLHVSRAHRRQGIASQLTAEVARLARADGTRLLYVSATPSDSAVGFYRSLGFEPTDAPNPELFALEPDDIHMTLEPESVTPGFAFDLAFLEQPCAGLLLCSAWCADHLDRLGSRR